MKKFIKKYRFWIISVLIVAIAVCAYSLYRSRSTNLLDRTACRDFKEMMDTAAEENGGTFDNQTQVEELIKSWADSKSLSYETDSSGNIIFDTPAVKRKAKVSPTLVCVGVNYRTAAKNSSLLASAAAIALSDMQSGRRTVVFCNDENNSGKGYKGLDSKYISSQTKLIYLDRGGSPYLSTDSFREDISRITIPAERERNVCDTAVKISIKGIDTGIPGPDISVQPDPVSALGTLLTRLKSRSVVYRLASVTTGSIENMYPESLDAVITLNSYSADSFTEYIDKIIKSWDKNYTKDDEDLEYTYEIIENPEQLPETTYSALTTDRLTEILYTVQTGAYRYEEDDFMPDGKEPGDIFGINCALDLKASDNNIVLKLMTQGYNDEYTERILSDNAAVAELYDCDFSIISSIEAFSNHRDSLARTFRNTYAEVNKIKKGDTGMPDESDDFFTPCSYFAEKNSKADIIHIRLSSKNYMKTANTVLCYIKSKGNASFF